MAFNSSQRYRIIRDLCEHPTIQRRNKQPAERLKLSLLVAKFGELVGEELAAELDPTLIDRTRVSEARELYNAAIAKPANKILPETSSTICVSRWNFF